VRRVSTKNWWYQSDFISESFCYIKRFTTSWRAAVKKSKPLMICVSNQASVLAGSSSITSMMGCVDACRSSKRTSLEPNEQQLTGRAAARTKANKTRLDARS
jgi:hypothetical protein